MLIAAALATGGNAAAQVQKQVAGPYVIELRVNPGQQVFETPMLFTITTADGKPVPTSAAKGRAEFSSGGLRGTATLYPDGVNGMKGYGLMSAKPDLTITVSLTLPGAAAVKATFSPHQPELPGKQ